MLLANAAMGLGLEMFQFDYWLAYVIATLLFEAWWIGRKTELSWFASLGISILANGITGLICPAFGAVLLHQPFLGTYENPNPFGNALVLFTGFGLISAIIELSVWQQIAKKNLWKPVILAHLIGVPLGLGILLIPSKPYVGLEALSGVYRGNDLVKWARYDLQSYIQERQSIPRFSSVPEALRALPRRGVTSHATGYVPDFGRFSFGKSTKPYLWNTALNGKKIGGEDNWVWLIRPPEGTRSRIIEVNLGTGEINARFMP